MTAARTVICACRVPCVALIDCNKTTKNKLITLTDNTFLRVESVILGLRAVYIRVTKILVRNCFPPARGTSGALLPLPSSSRWTGWSGPGIFHTGSVSLGSSSGTHFAGDTKDRPVQLPVGEHPQHHVWYYWHKPGTRGARL